MRYATCHTALSQEGVMTQTKNILIGLDFSPGSMRALEYAVELAQQLHATLHIIHIVEPLPVAAVEPVQVYVDLDERKAQCEEVCQRIVGDRATYTLRVFDSLPLEGLLAAIYELHPELVVVGSHGRSAVMRLLVG